MEEKKIVIPEEYTPISAWDMLDTLYYSQFQ